MGGLEISNIEKVINKNKDTNVSSKITAPGQSKIHYSPESLGLNAKIEKT